MGNEQRGKSDEEIKNRRKGQQKATKKRDSIFRRKDQPLACKNRKNR